MTRSTFYSARRTPNQRRNGERIIYKRMPRIACAKDIRTPAIFNKSVIAAVSEDAKLSRISSSQLGGMRSSYGDRFRSSAAVFGICRKRAIRIRSAKYCTLCVCSALRLVRFFIFETGVVNRHKIFILLYFSFTWLFCQILLAPKITFLHLIQRINKTMRKLRIILQVSYEIIYLNIYSCKSVSVILASIARSHQLWRLQHSEEIKLSTALFGEFAGQANYTTRPHKVPTP